MVEAFAVHPLDAFLENAASNPDADVEVRIVESSGIAQVFAANGKTASVCRTLKIKESPGKATVTEAFVAIPLAPGQWLMVSDETKPERNLVTRLAGKLKSNGFVSEQSDSRVIFRVSGDGAVELMRKGCRLDLHSSVTGENWCAQTQIAQIGVVIHQLDAKPTYDLYVYSGFARDFAEWLAHTGAQLGISFRK